MFRRFAVALLLTLPAFAGRIVFTFNPLNTSSSLTLASDVGAQVEGFSGVLSVSHTAAGVSLPITGGTLSFISGGRTSTPGDSGFQTLNAGGSWQITGSITNGSQSVSGVLVSGIFVGPSSILNLTGRNTFDATIQVTFADPTFLQIMGATVVVDNTNTMTLARPGTWSSVTGVFANASGGGTTNGTLSFDSDVPEPATLSFVGVAMGALIAIRVKKTRNAA